MYKVSRQYTGQQQCATCSVRFREISNIGQHLCRVHPGLKMSDATGWCYYSCCGAYCSPQSQGNLDQAAGCLSLDHMSSPLSCTSLNTRLLDLQRFSTTVVPTGLFEHGMAQPLFAAIIHRQEDRESGGQIVMEHRLTALEEVKEHHSLLREEHCTGRHGILIDRDGDESREALSVALDLQDLCQRYATRVGPTLERMTSTEGEGWVSLQQLRSESSGGGNGWGGGQRRPRPPF